MKKLLIMLLFVTAFSANAFWNNNGFNSYQDNGIFGFNPYDYWEPDWYSREMDNMIDEFDDNRYNNYSPYGSGYGGYNPYSYQGYNPYNSYGNFNNRPWNNRWGR